MKKIESAGQLERILVQSPRCLVDFYADWCGPCQIIKPILENIEDIDVFSVDVDVLNKVAAKYEVMTLPTIILFEDGKPIKSLSGSQTKENIEKFYKK